MTRRLLLALLPLLLLGALLAVIVRSGPADAVRGENFPPVERLTFQRVTLEPGAIVASVMNDGPDAVTIAQVQVDDAFWTFTAANGVTLRHLGQTRLRIPYPWVAGEAHVVRVLTSTGTAFEHGIPVAVETPRPSARFFGVFTLIVSATNCLGVSSKQTTGRSGSYGSSYKSSTSSIAATNSALTAGMHHCRCRQGLMAFF